MKTKHTANLTAEAVEILVKNINVDQILGIGVAMSDIDYPTTADEIAWAFALEAADFGLRASTEDRLRKLYPDYDKSDGIGGMCKSSVYQGEDGVYFTRVFWSLHTLPNTGEWLVVVDRVDDYRVMSDEETRRGLEELGLTFN